jgi:hypothetical protein
MTKRKRMLLLSEEASARWDLRAMTKRKRMLLLFLLAGAAASACGGWLYYERTFPYGWSHSCDKGLMFALHQYAEEHGGAYPAGEATPEASLSLLYPKHMPDPEVLRGKTVPYDIVKTILEQGGRLGPDTCGWHYVEGLRLDDDRRLAICWDKVGLGHNGQRLSDGGRFVLLVNMGYEYIPGPKWKEFLDEQEKLLAARNNRKHGQ